MYECMREVKCGLKKQREEGGGKEWKQELRLWALLSKSRLQLNGEKKALREKRCRFLKLIMKTEEYLPSC